MNEGGGSLRWKESSGEGPAHQGYPPRPKFGNISPITFKKSPSVLFPPALLSELPGAGRQILYLSQKVAVVT